MDMSPIRLRRRLGVLGTEYQPANEAAELACAIAGTRFMSQRTLAVLKQYNLHIVVEAIGEKVL